MERSYIDDLSDALSVISQDRMSDDTDFLIGHNISMNNLNDSYLDVKSSTTTDLIYQQELNESETEILVSPSKTKVKLENHLPYKDGEEKLLSTVINTNSKSYVNEDSFANSKIISLEKGRKEDYIIGYKFHDQIKKNDDIDYAKKNNSVNTDFKDSRWKDDKIKEHDSSGEVSKSGEEMKHSKDSSISATGNNWKYRSIQNSSGEDLSFEKDVNGKTSHVFSDSLSGNC